MVQGKKILWITGALGFVWVSLLGVRAEADGIVPKQRFDQRSQLCRDLNFSNSSWASEGSALFLKTCKSCHSHGNNKGAPFLYSESLPPQGWSRVFFERYPKCAKDGSWSGLTNEQLTKINDYLFRNAYGTWDPNSDESCG